MADAVKIAIDAGVNRSHGNGEGNDPKKRGSPLFHKEKDGNLIGIAVDAYGTQNGQCHGQNKTGGQMQNRPFVVFCGGFPGHIFGNSGLYTGHRQGKGQGKDRGDELINAHAFRTKNT